jgi:hypothetical protein
MPCAPDLKLTHNLSLQVLTSYQVPADSTGRFLKITTSEQLPKDLAIAGP